MSGASCCALASSGLLDWGRALWSAVTGCPWSGISGAGYLHTFANQQHLALMIFYFFFICPRERQRRGRAPFRAVSRHGLRPRRCLLDVLVLSAPCGLRGGSSAARCRPCSCGLYHRYPDYRRSRSSSAMVAARLPLLWRPCCGRLVRPGPSSRHAGPPEVGHPRLCAASHLPPSMAGSVVSPSPGPQSRTPSPGRRLSRRSSHCVRRPTFCRRRGWPVRVTLHPCLLPPELHVVVQALSWLLVFHTRAAALLDWPDAAARRRWSGCSGLPLGRRPQPLPGPTWRCVSDPPLREHLALCGAGCVHGARYPLVGDCRHFPLHTPPSPGLVHTIIDPCSWSCPSAERQPRTITVSYVRRCLYHRRCSVQHLCYCCLWYLRLSVIDPCYGSRHSAEQ